MVQQILAAVQKLNDLAAVRERLEALKAEKDSQEKVILAPVQAELQALASKYNEQIASLEMQATDLESEVKTEVLTLKESVKGDRLHAVWAKGRVSWDDGKLVGYAEAHPEILPWRKVGEPSVSIRTLKD